MTFSNMVTKLIDNIQLKQTVTKPKIHEPKNNVAKPKINEPKQTAEKSKAYEPKHNVAKADTHKPKHLEYRKQMTIFAVQNC